MPPPGGMPPPPQGPPQGATGLGPATALAGLFADLNPTHGPGWQSVDLAIRAVKTALRSSDFQKLPAVVAVMQSVQKTMTELLTAYTSGSSGSSASAGPPPAPQDRSQSDTISADADAQPGASSDADES